MSSPHAAALVALRRTADENHSSYGLTLKGERRGDQTLAFSRIKKSFRGGSASGSRGLEGGAAAVHGTAAQRVTSAERGFAARPAWTRDAGPGRSARPGSPLSLPPPYRLLMFTPRSRMA